MFGTLSYNHHRQEPVFEADTTFPSSISSTDSSKRGTTIHQACELCRAPKLRCSANPSGCDRCKASSNVCKYPPRRFRTSRKRGLASRTSTSSRGNLATGGTTSNQSDICGDEEFGQRDWQKLFGSVENEDNQPLSIHKFLETNYGLDSHLTSIFPGSNHETNNFADYNFGGAFELPWQESYIARNKTASSPGRLPDPVPQPSRELWRDPAVLRTSDCDNGSTYLKSSGFTGAETLVGCEWPEATVGTTPELSSGPSLSRSNSFETVRTYSERERGETKAYGDGNHCQCLNLIARLLEQVETKGTTSQESIDGLLETCREPMRQCKTLMACPHCKSRSECILLLAMLAKSLSVVCNGLVQRYVQGRLEGNHGQLEMANQWPKVRVGAYLVPDSTDRCTVVEALIVARLNNLHDILIDLRARSMRREGHLALLVQVEERVRYLKTLMSMSASRCQVIDINKDSVVY